MVERHEFHISLIELPGLTVCFKEQVLESISSEVDGPIKNRTVDGANTFIERTLFFNNSMDALHSPDLITAKEVEAKSMGRERIAKVWCTRDAMEDINPTDGQLISQVLDGDSNSYGLLMARYESKFLRFAQTIVHDEDDAADVVQDAFIKIYQNLRSYDPKRPFSSWAYRIVRNEGLNFLRARKRMFFGETAELVLNNLASLLSPELEYAGVELRDRVGAALAQLPSNYREPLQLHFLEEQSYKEISAQLAIPIGTVGTRINRAKAMLRKLWGTKA